MNKLRTALSKFGEFWGHIAYFWLALGRNQFGNTKFSKLVKEITDPIDEVHCTQQSKGRKAGRKGQAPQHYIAFVLHDPSRQRASIAISVILVVRVGRYGITSTCDGGAEGEGQLRSQL